MPLPETAVAVIGAGPAGITAALALLRQGITVTLVDPGHPPAPRIESLAANGIALAKTCGLGAALGVAGLGRAAVMQLHWRAHTETRDFGTDGPLLLERTPFHAALRELLPASCLLGGRVTGIASHHDRVTLATTAGPLVARFVIDARGRARQRAEHGDAAVMVALGFNGHGARTADRPAMLLEALADGWLWACRLPGGRVDGALFLPSSHVAGKDGAVRRKVLAQHLRASALGLPDGLSAGQVTLAMAAAVRDPFAAPLVLRVGDAALANDPLTSHGLVPAMRSGVQAAAAAASCIGVAGEADAARSFVRDRHARVARAASEATFRSLAEQSRFHGGIWFSAGNDGLGPAPPPRNWPALSRPLALAPLVRTAALAHGRIVWTEAVWLARRGEAAPRLGPFGATELAQLLGPPAPIAVLSARLAQRSDESMAQSILRLLLEEEALSERTADQLAAMASNA